MGGRVGRWGKKGGGDKRRERKDMDILKGEGGDQQGVKGRK